MLESITWDGLSEDTRRALWRTMQGLDAQTKPGGKGATSTPVWLTIKKFMAEESMTLASEDERQALLGWVNQTWRGVVRKAGGATAERDAHTTDIVAELIVLQAEVTKLPVGKASQG